MHDLQRADPNPYAPPGATDGGGDRLPAPGARIEGELLVLRRGTPLPSLCVKCSTPDQLELCDQGFHYRPTWAQFVGIFGILLGVRRSAFQLPLCPACRAMWTKWDRLAGPAFLVPMLVVGILAALLLAVPAPSHVPSFIGIVALLIGLGIGKSVVQFRRRRHVVSATRIDGDETWLRGVHDVVVRALTAVR
jgi:xanthosine utilization system XapX-like protein